MSRAKKVKAAILKMIDLKVKTYQFEGKTVTREDLFEILEQEEQSPDDFVYLIDYSDESRSLEVVQVDKMTTQLCFECDPENWTKSVNSWMFKINFN